MSRVRNGTEESSSGTITAKQNQRILENKQEHKKNKDYEEQLADVSVFSYSEVDYIKDLVRNPYEEQPVPSMDYLYAEAALATEKAFNPILRRNTNWVLGSAAAMLFWGLFISSKNIVYFPILLLLLAVGLLSATFLYQAMKLKNEKMNIERQKIKTIIEQKMAAEQATRDSMKAAFEKYEDDRIAEIEEILSGNQGAILHRLSTVVPKMNFPFLAGVDINIISMIPMFKVYLPNRSVIPQSGSVLHPNGKLSYDKKSVTTINKEYLELCSAVCIRILAVIYENVPTFDKGYLNAVVKDDIGERCVIKAVFERAAIKDACSKVNGIAAIQSLAAEYYLDEEFYLLRMEEGFPPEWGEFVQRMIDKIHIKIFK